MFAQSGPQQQKRFGTGTCLPAYLAPYDVNGDGIIDTEEQQAMVQARDQIRKGLRANWDTNGDGTISDEERDQARLRLRDMITECRNTRFTEADIDQDGALSYEEFNDLPGMVNKDVALVEKIFVKLDADDDGLVTLEEFLAAVQQCDQARDGTCPAGTGGPGGPGGPNSSK
ncbi:MAG: EF-hand domain-containing protein [Verrucomicrobiota bacterium]